MNFASGVAVGAIAVVAILGVSIYIGFKSVASVAEEFNEQMRNAQKKADEQADATA